MSRHTTAARLVAAAALATLARASGEGAELPASGPLPLAAVVEWARAQNPALEAARRRTAAAEAEPTRAAAWDDPTVSWEIWNAPESFRVERADNNIVRLSQKLPFPGKRRLAGEAARRDADMARRDADGVELDVLADVERAYYELWKRHQQLAVHSRDKELVQRYARIAESRYAVGEASQPDVLRAQVELTRLINRVTTGMLAIDEARAELNALLSRVPDAPLGVPEDPPPPRLAARPEDLIALALDHRPELAAQAAAVAREQTALRLARMNYLPDFEVAASRFINRTGGDGFGAMASISIPLAFKSKYDAGVEQASARLAAARADQRRLEDRVRREVQQAFLRARSALERHQLFVSTHIPQAEQALRASEAAYQTGRMDFLSLIDSVRAIEAIHLEHYEADADFEEARADLERAVGTELPHAAPEGRP